MRTKGREMQNYSLLADVGGTNTRVAIAQDGVLDRRSVQRFRNDDFADLYSVIRSYLDTNPIQPTAVCVDIAGPIENGAGSLTNRNWMITPQDLCATTGAKTARVINDMQAQGLALGSLSQDQLKPCVLGHAESQSQTRLVINVGTGFNSAVVLKEPSGLIVPGSETGHVDLPSNSSSHYDLYQYLTDTHGFASVEDVLSGRGLENVYAWHASTQEVSIGRTTHQIFETLDQDPIAAAAVKTTVEIFGQICGNLALTHLPFGGIYLVGGMAQALHPYLDRFGFTAAFQAKGRFSEFMQQFSVSLVDDDHAPLVGCIAALHDQSHGQT